MAAYERKFQNSSPTRKCLVASCVALFVLGAVAIVIAVGITFGIPTRSASWTYHQCKTASQQPGFLCEDRTTCLLPSLLCDGKMDCSDGGDESAAYCGQVPNSLPQNLIFKCAGQKTWVYVDRVCDMRNDCGDCSDESGNQSCLLSFTSSSRGNYKHSEDMVDCAADTSYSKQLHGHRRDSAALWLM
ncbi:low-density lipoprotein receptor class A domain-containing protein 1-like [Alexandromys fortis]|uniref:low-density lipoprotein receptor class A domain-containing protein 1-like n=1 Tax=Alexandromys fortis TaxID=100897 RepID=UPI0021532D07|nr:low-density lipoprotein receptor class A domain-containing protein 1-like [Microtus fortis]